MNKNNNKNNLDLLGLVSPAAPDGQRLPTMHCFQMDDCDSTTHFLTEAEIKSKIVIYCHHQFVSHPKNIDARLFYFKKRIFLPIRLFKKVEI